MQPLKPAPAAIAAATANPAMMPLIVILSLHPWPFDGTSAHYDVKRTRQIAFK